MEYWTEFRNFLLQHKSFVKTGKPQPHHWMNFAIGRVNFSLVAFANTRERRIGVGLVLSGSVSKSHFHLLEREKSAIESEIGMALDWRENPGKIESHIYLHQRNMDPTIKNYWPEQHQWLCENLEAFKKVFAPRVKMLNADNYQPGEVIEKT